MKTWRYVGLALVALGVAFTTGCGRGTRTKKFLPGFSEHGIAVLAFSGDGL